MAGLIERNAKNIISLKQRTGISDGKPVFGTAVSCLAMIFDFRQSDKNEFGSIQNGKIFLIAPLSSPPALPGFVSCDGNDYEMKSVKILRNLKGVVLGYRVAAAGA